MFKRKGMNDATLSNEAIFNPNLCYLDGPFKDWSARYRFKLETQDSKIIDAELRQNFYFLLRIILKNFVKICRFLNNFEKKYALKF